ncbi:hypothetical protein [Actinomadura hibisca]|uniref:hypothetical protein n=1 Tax=Actinomadura hibisca TaxID=68565 RepID=UPI00082BABDE|nr:hypothetical protein [Actinomadura hibisca]
MSGGHAHYVIIDGDNHQVWTRDRGASGLFRDLLPGPEAAISFIRAQEGGTPNRWMNSVWWEGVALLDLRRRLLLVHTNQEMPGLESDTSVPQIRAWLNLVGACWPGWRVKWASRGLFEVMDYLELPYSTVLYLDDPPSPLHEQWAYEVVDDEDPTAMAHALVTIRSAPERLSFAGWWGDELGPLLLAGPDPLLVPQDEASTFAVLDGVPYSGLLLDVPERRADWWSIDCLHDPRLLPARWPGWTLTDHGDAYEEVAALIGPELLIDTPPEAEVLRQVRAALEA